MALRPGSLARRGRENRLHLEFLPGVGLLFFDADLDPLFDAADDNEALVDFENPVFNFKFGISYTSSGY